VCDTRRRAAVQYTPVRFLPGAARFTRCVCFRMRWSPVPLSRDKPGGRCHLDTKCQHAQVLVFRRHGRLRGPVSCANGGSYRLSQMDVVICLLEKQNCLSVVIVYKTGHIKGKSFYYSCKQKAGQGNINPLKNEFLLNNI
jgi:hypothetical protein